jgi:hypothetical protein
LKWLRREMLVLTVFGGFGLLALPAMVFIVGQQLLGEYRPGAGMGVFYADLYRHLGAMEPFAWLLVLGPYLAVQLLRLLWLPLGLLTRRRPPPREESPPARRAEPVI